MSQLYSVVKILAERGNLTNLNPPVYIQKEIHDDVLGVKFYT